MRQFALIAAIFSTCAFGPPLCASPELVLQTGHVGEVDHLQYSPDGKWVASGSTDGTVKIWDASTGALKSTLPIHHGAIAGIDFVKAGAEIAVVAGDGWASRWDPANGTLLASAAGPVDNPEVGAITERGGKVLVATCGSDHSIKLWNLPDKSGQPVKALASLDGHTEIVTAMAFSADGAFLASGSVTGEDRFWDVDDQSLIRKAHGHAMWVRSIALTADGKKCIDACDDGISDVYDVQTAGDPIQLQMNAPGDGIGAAAFSTDGLVALTGGHPNNDGHEYADLWDVGAATIRTRLTGKIGYVTAAAVSPNGKSVATGGVDQAIRFWNVAATQKTASAAHVLGGDESTAFAVARNGSMLVAGGSDGMLRFWSLHSGELVHAFAGKPGTARAVAATVDGKLVLTGGIDNGVTVRDFDKGAVVKTLPFPGRVDRIAVSSNGKLIAAGGFAADGDTGAIRIWNTSTWAVVDDFDAQSEVRGIAFSVDGSTLASADGGPIGPGMVTLWNLATKKDTTLYFPDKNSDPPNQDTNPRDIRAVAMSGDGRRVVVASGLEDPDPNHDDRPTGLHAIVWNAKTGAWQREFTIPQMGGRLESIAINADSTLMAAGDNAGTVRLWNPKTGDLVSTLDGSVGAVTSTEFTPDGTALITSGADSAIRVWDTSTGKLRGTLIPFASTEDWLAVTPDGYYDGSADASRFIRWQVGPASFPVDAFAASLHQPAEVAKSLAGLAVSTLPPDAQIGAVQSMPPTVTFVTPHDGAEVSTENINITVRVASSKPVKSVVLYANGRPVAQGGKPLELGAKPLELGAKPLELGAKPLELGAKALEVGAKDLNVVAGAAPPADMSEYGVTLPFKPGDASVVLSAVAVDDGMRQGRQEVRVLRAGASQALGKLYVLSVGVSKYANPDFNLKYAAADADAFTGLWKPHAGNLYSSIETTELLNDNATVVNVRAALFNLLEKATDQDTVVLFLSGHGIVLDDGSYYFATHEIDPATADTVAATGLPWSSFQLALGRLKAKHVLMFLDACHSGNALGNRQARAERMAEALASGSGVIVFSSSRGSEYSYEFDSLGHGAFTQALIEGLGEGKANFSVGGATGTVISAEEVLAYLRLRVPQLTDNQQTPSCPLLQDFGDPFPLVSQ